MDRARAATRAPKQAMAAEQWRHVERLRVDGRDDDERDDVVDDDDGEHEGTQAVGKVRPDEREQAESEGRVGRHRDSPPACRRAAGVEREVDGDGHGHAADPRQQGQGQAPPVPQLAQIELTARLEADDEEEERHQPVVHPAAQIQRDARVPEVDRQHRPPERVVGRCVDVHPDEGGDGRREQDRRAAGLRTQELPQRRLEGPCPRRPSGDRRWPTARVTATDGASPPRPGVSRLGVRMVTSPQGRPRVTPCRHGPARGGRQRTHRGPAG